MQLNYKLSRPPETRSYRLLTVHMHWLYQNYLDGSCQVKQFARTCFAGSNLFGLKYFDYQEMAAAGARKPRDGLSEADEIPGVSC